MYITCIWVDYILEYTVVYTAQVKSERGDFIRGENLGHTIVIIVKILLFL